MVKLLTFPLQVVMFFMRAIVQTVFLALGQVMANWLRALLTALGIIIGTAAVVAVIAGLTGMRSHVMTQFEQFGARKMWIGGQVPRSMRSTMSWSQVRMSPREARAILDRAPSIDAVTPISFDRYDVTSELETKRGVRVQGIWPEWHEIENRQILFGRQFSRIDEENRLQVCIVNDHAVEELKLPRDPTGEYLIMNQRRFLIVGMVETKTVDLDFSGGGDQPRTEIYVPFATAKLMDPYSWTMVMAQMTEPELSEDAQAEVRFILRTMRGLGPEDEDTFWMNVIQQQIDQFKQMSGMVTMVATVIVSISLLVGGIGIMNIMLVSVSERTREIGLRKAVGARPPIVLLQFLVEAVVLCLAGGLIGLSLGHAAAQALRSIPGVPLEQAVVPAWAGVLALSFSAAVGVVFGMFPALKAASLNPIEALRHE